MAPHICHAADGAFFKTVGSRGPNNYQAYTQLRFGKVYLNANCAIVATASHQHSAGRKSKLFSFKIEWGSKQLTPLHFIGGGAKAHTRLGQGPAGPEHETHFAYDSLGYTLGNLGIWQGWAAKNSTLSFSLKGGGSAKWDKFQIAISGARNNLTRNGILVEDTANKTSVLITNPVAFGKSNGHWQQITCKYIAVGKGTGLQFAVPVASYDSIYVDPQLVFSGYSGSTADNWGTTATYDAAGNTLLAGIAFGFGFPTTSAGFQRVYNGLPNSFTSDVVIQKFSANGRQMLAATYLGGSSEDVPQSIVCRPDGSVVILGTTGSANFPVTRNAYQASFIGGPRVDPYQENFMIYPRGSDFFIAILSPNLDRLLESTYLGGSDNEGINNCLRGITANYGDEFRGTVEVTKQGNILICGLTFSANFPVQNALQPNYGGGGDGVICQFSADLQLQYATYIGGARFDIVNNLSLSSTGAVGFCGATASVNLPVTPGAYQSEKRPSAGANIRTLDGFAGVLPSNLGTQAIFITYSGTNEYDQAYFTAFDPAGYLWVLGQSTGNMPFYGTNGFGSTTGGLFLQQFAIDGSAVLVSARLGSLVNVPNISPTAFSIDLCGQIYLAGWGGELPIKSPCTYVATTTRGLAITPDAVQKVTDGADFYVAVLRTGATSLKYATFLGGAGVVEHVDGGTSRFDPKGQIYGAVCAGCGGNSLFPTTPGVFNGFNASNNCNMAAFKIDLTPLTEPLSVTPPKDTLCLGLPIVITHNAALPERSFISLGDGSPQTPATSPFTYTYKSAGRYRVVVVGKTSACAALDSVINFVTILDSAAKNKDTTVTFCNAASLLINLPRTPARLAWTGAPTIAPDTGYSVTVINPQNGQQLTLSYENRGTGCKAAAQVTLRGAAADIAPRARIAINSCLGSTDLLLFASQKPDSLLWQFNGLTYATDTVRLTFLSPIADTAIFTGKRNGCTQVWRIPVAIPIEKAILNLTVTKDSALVSCDEIKYTYKAPPSNSTFYRWYSGITLLSGEKFFAPPQGLVSTEIKLKAFSGPCVDSITFLHRPLSLFIPNVVTVNADTLNATFVLQNMPAAVIMHIYDRWGKLVAQNVVAREGYAFANEPAGVYFYCLLKDSKAFCKGWVELVKQ